MKTLDLETLVLLWGSHKNPDSGMCVMEAVAFVAGEPFSDHPQCACPTLGAFMRSWNDSLDDTTRQKLKPYIPRLVGTNDGNSERRGWMCLDWLSRECTASFLELGKLTDCAEALRALPEIKDLYSLKSAQPILDAAKAAAGDAAKAAARGHAGAAARDAAWAAAWAAARVAAWAAARDAARDAAWAAARAAARAAAGDAAWDAAGDAAWDAAQDAARDAAWDAAGDAAGDAARVAAWAAARDAAGDAAGDAARDAAWAAASVAARDAAGRTLAPVAEKLQASAFGLIDRMMALPELDLKEPRK